MPQVGVICEYCGKEFMVFPSLLNHGMGRFCSRSCARRARYGEPFDLSYVPDSKRKVCVCKVCGEEFYLTPSGFEQTENAGTYCSKRCRGEDTWQNWVCVYCGQEFKCAKEYTHWREDGEGPFCSSECQRLFTWVAWADDIFDPLQPDGAYILGFLIADGHVSDHGYGVSFSQKDPDILQKIATRLGYEGKVYKEPNRPFSQLVLYSKKAHKTLIEKYDIPAGNKSLTVRLPNVGKRLLPHLIRGMFDGDGSVVEDGGQFSYYSGSLGLAKDFVDIMTRIVKLPYRGPKNCARSIRKDGTFGTCYQVQWSQAMEAREFAKFIYGPKLDVYGSSLYLERKRERFTPLFTFWREREFLEEELVKRQRSIGEVAAWCGTTSWSLRHAMKWYGLTTEVERICEHCGRKFLVNTAIVKVNRKYCSDKCMRVSRVVGRVGCKCRQCGTIFEVRPKDTRVYCSKQCAKLGRIGSHYKSRFARST